MKKNDEKCTRALKCGKDSLTFRAIIPLSVSVSRNAYTLSIVEDSFVVLGQVHNDAINARIFLSVPAEVILHEFLNAHMI